MGGHGMSGGMSGGKGDGNAEEMALYVIQFSPLN
jgi:hypothetical protein